MKFEAVICLRLVVPFEANVEELDLSPFTAILADGTESIGEFGDKAGYEAKLAEIDEQRRAVGIQAEQELVAKMKQALAGDGEVIFDQVEEVREA